MSSIRKQEHAFWVTNICNKNVSLADLRLSVKAHTTVNLLDSRHYSYSLEQLQASAASGSIHAKQSMIKVRMVAPQVFKRINIELSNQSRPSPNLYSPVTIENVEYEELNVSDEAFADELAETINEDQDTALKPKVSPLQKSK